MKKKNIPLLLDRFDKVIGRKNIEVILIDNGSTDGSSEIMKELVLRYPFAQMFHIDVNQGYGYGILQGLKRAEGDYIGWTHADMQADPADIVKAWKIICRQESDPLYIKGLRKDRPLFDRFFTAGMSLFESIYFKQRLYDINAQPNIFPKDFFQKWINPPHDFSLDLYALYQAKVAGLKEIRFKVEFPERIHGHSSWNDGLASKWKFIKRTLGFSRRLKHFQKFTPNVDERKNGGGG